MAKLISDTLSRVVHWIVVLIICVLTVKQCFVLRDTQIMSLSAIVLFLVVVGDGGEAHSTQPLAG